MLTSLSFCVWTLPTWNPSKCKTLGDTLNFQAPSVWYFFFSSENGGGCLSGSGSCRGTADQVQAVARTARVVAQQADLGDVVFQRWVCEQPRPDLYFFALRDAIFMLVGRDRPAAGTEELVILVVTGVVGTLSRKLRRPFFPASSRPAEA